MSLSRSLKGFGGLRCVTRRCLIDLDPSTVGSSSMPRTNKVLSPVLSSPLHLKRRERRWPPSARLPSPPPRRPRLVLPPSRPPPRRHPSLRVASPSSRRPRRGAVMMDTAASSYAKALAEVARSNGTLEATVTDMEKEERVFADPNVQSFFANPTVAPERKAEVVKEIAASSELCPHTSSTYSSTCIVS
ncbi:hypothetical protein C4D60_Mb00t08780 [Musa balbisiana]|uniref:Uncharacterized protein n=1 Tax=Musa balbisiana TaxID=52838 RepID=A0A4S8I7A0_MUSBA|nr:hypothetical protein C4D60_Mb00t08780 [Musa balbisiana]